MCSCKTKESRERPFLGRFFHLLTYIRPSLLKEYYEIVDEAHPLSGFFPHMLIFLQKCISNPESKQGFKFQSDLSPNCFTIDVLKYKLLISTVYFLSFLFFIFLYRILRHLHEFCSVLRCDILGIGLF